MDVLRSFVRAGECDALFDLDAAVEYAVGDPANCDAWNQPKYKSQLDRVFAMGFGIGVAPTQPSGPSSTLSFRLCSCRSL